MTKPSVNVKAVANHYASPGERIIEITFPSGKGCLVSLVEREGDVVASINIYRADAGIVSHHQKENS